MLHGSETWRALNHADAQRMGACHCKYLRIPSRRFWKRKSDGGFKLEQPNEQVEDDLKIESIDECIRRRQLRWVGHIARMEDGSLPSVMTFGWTKQRKRGAPAADFLKAVEIALENREAGLDVWYDQAQDRNEWRKTVVYNKEDEDLFEGSPEMPKQGCANTARNSSKPKQQQHACTHMRRKPGQTEYCLRHLRT